MKKEKSLSELFEQAKKATPEIPVSEIKSLVESGQTSPLASKPSYRPRRITRLFNPLKILIMITPIVIITASLINWNSGHNAPMEQPEQIQAEQIIQQVGPKKNEATLIKSQPASRLTVPEPAVVTGFNPGVPAEIVQTVQKDTVLAGVILDLSKEELTRLGFMFDDEGYYYLNQLPDGSKLNFWSYRGPNGGSFGFASGGFVNQSNKAKLGNFDFYPVLTTNFFGEEIHPIQQFSTQAKTSFELMNDTLVPILFSRNKLGGYNTPDMLVWFKVSDRFFNLLDSEKTKKAKSICDPVKERVNILGVNQVSYDYKSLLMPKLIKLKREVLERLGITVTSSRIEYKFRTKTDLINVQYDSIGTRVSCCHITRPDSSGMGISSDENRLLPIAMAGSLNVNMDFSDMDIDFALPIQLDDSTASPFLQDWVMWINPNDFFFECLPPEIAEPMRKEFNYQLKKMNPDSSPVMGGSIGIGGNNPQKDTTGEDNEPVPCVYFTNLCETIPGLDYINLYPNPASAKINVDLVLLTAKKIRFRVFDLGGRVISDDGAVENYPTGGRFTHQLDISPLQNGFYLLVLTDEEGARVTRRFIKE